MGGFLQVKSAENIDCKRDSSYFTAYKINRGPFLNMINEPIITEDIVRPTQVVVNLDRLAANFNAIKERAGSAKVMPVLKANAYGHGLVRTARLMEELNADYLGVAVLEEALLLRERGIALPILVMGGILGNQIPHFINNDLTITASSIDKLKQIDETACSMKLKAKVHLKIDTGLERIGVHYYNAESFILEAAECKNIIVEGLFSHFADSDNLNISYAATQLQRFQSVLDIYGRHGIEPPPIKHMANSGAILQLPEAFMDMVRPGIILYGVYPSQETRRTVNVKPALTWKSRVVYFKVIAPGHPVGYGSTWQPEVPIRAVTVPLGYGDGYFRSMSHKAHVLIRGRRYPVIGVISMDQIVVNIGSDSAFNEDEVILIGEADSGESITSEDLAKWADTIPYEILTNINTRVPRIYVTEKSGLR